MTATYSTTQNENTKGTPPRPIAHPWSYSISTAPVSSALYQIYTQLYEEVKCIGVKARIAVTSAVGGSDIPSLIIRTGWDRRIGEGDPNPTYADLKVFSTQQTVTAVNNSIAKLTRSLYASDLMEKAQWHDCSLKTINGFTQDAAYVAAGANPNFFCPGLFIAFEVPNVTVQTNINFAVDVTYYFAFRNPKYGGTAVESGGR